MISSIFEKNKFTLKELCNFIINSKINDEYINKELFSGVQTKENTIDYDNIINKQILNEIAYCYILFSSNNSNYRKFLINSRNNKGFLFKTNNKIINLREILQIFDLEFTKLIIRIKTECNNYDIHITWDDFENKIGIDKNHFKNLFYFSK